MEAINPEDFEIVAKRGDCYLLAPKAQDPQDIKAQGRVLDVGEGVLHDSYNIHSILKHGYWEPFEGQQSRLPILLQEAIGGRE